MAMPLTSPGLEKLMPWTEPKPNAISRPAAITPFQYLTAIMCAAIATTVLAGWSVGNQRMTQILAGSIAMNPMTAVSILAISAALVLRGPGHAASVRALGGLVALIGIGKLLQLAIGQPSGGIDQLLFSDQLAAMAGATPNRMAPNTAVAITAIGLGLMTSRSLRIPVLLLSQGLCVVSAVTAAAALVGYALDEVASTRFTLTSRWRFRPASPCSPCRSRSSPPIPTSAWCGSSATAAPPGPWRGSRFRSPCSSP